MLKSYLAIAWRNLKKHKSFTAINVVGLSLSMSVFLLLILLTYDHHQYDQFHPQGNRTFRILSYQKGTKGQIFGEGYATSPLAFKKELEGKYASIKTIANLNHGLRGEVRSEFKVLEIERSLFADPEFFEVFGFQLAEGDPKYALDEPFSMVLTTEMANKLFPKGNAVGQVVDFEDHGNYKITGVFAPIINNSHIVFQALASFSTIPILVEKEIFSESYDDWDNIWSNYNYLVLNDKDSRDEVLQLINDIGDLNIQPEDVQDPGYEFDLQGITEVVPGILLSNEIGFALPRLAIVFFSFLGLILIITASINYTNLSVARSLSRVREIGIRKANGASKRHIISQFLVESVMISMLSLILAVLIYQFLIQRFNELWIFSVIGIELKDTAFAYIFFVVFSLLLGLIAGIGPAMYMSKIDTIKSLKGSLHDGAHQGTGWTKIFSVKKLLLGIQFGLTIIMLITIFLLRDQANYLSRSNYGFNKDQIYFVELQGHDPKVIKSVFEGIPGIEGSATTSHHPAVGRTHGSGYRIDADDEPITLFHFGVDHHYIEVMDIQLIAGNNFPETITGDKELFIILNELAVQRMGFENPSAAIGQHIMKDDDTQMLITGVVKDYHWEPMMKAIRPLVLRVLPEDYQYAYFKIQTDLPFQLSDRMKSTWEQFDQAREYKGGFLVDQVNLFYQFMYDLGGILTFVSLITISITMLGFLGMVSFHLKTRIKEIGIRKALGAGFWQMTVALTKGFLIMLVITLAIGVPLAVFVNDLWISNMAIHSPISLLNVGPPILIVLLITVLTIFSQMWRTSSSNPVDALRSE